MRAGARAAELREAAEQQQGLRLDPAIVDSVPREEARSLSALLLPLE